MEVVKSYLSLWCPEVARCPVNPETAPRLPRLVWRPIGLLRCLLSAYRPLLLRYQFKVFTCFTKAHLPVLSEVVNRIPFAVAATTPVTRVLGIRPHTKAVITATPGTHTCVFPAMSTGNPL